MQSTKSNVVSMYEKYPFKNSPQSLTLDNEIKRIAKERGETIEEVIGKLAKFSNLKIRQIYNYRAGVSDIPSSLIPVFCRQFGSNALAKTILQQCEPTDTLEDFDLVKLANQSARETMDAHSRFLEAFEDGQIDGFELNEVKKKTASGVAWFHRLEQIVTDAYNRHRTA